MPLKVGLTYNLKRDCPPNEYLPEDFDIEFDDETTVNAIANALKKYEVKLTKIEADENAYLTLKRLTLDFVFNIAEGFKGESRESQIPAMLEMLGIPYTGSGPLTLAISLNKAVTHQLLYANGVSSPSFQVFNKPNEKLASTLRFPLIVKPLSEGSSKGIRNDSLVEDEKTLRKKLSWVIRTYNQAAMVETFLPGREFTICLLGNNVPTVLPIVEILFDKLPEIANPLYSYEAKWIWDVPEKPLAIFRCPASVKKKLEEEIKETAVKTFKILGCRDLCRIDLRLDDNNTPRVIDVNPLPGLIPNPDAHSCFPEAARAAGLSYDQLICKIFQHALKRYE